MLAVGSPICLRPHYAMSGTDLALPCYQDSGVVPVRYPCTLNLVLTWHMALRFFRCTNAVNGATGTDVAYGAMGLRCTEAG
eukprot:3435600-Rhodomonas_salina.12